MKNLELPGQESDRSGTVSVEGHSLLKGQFKALQRRGVLPATTHALYEKWSENAANPLKLFTDSFAGVKILASLYHLNSASDFHTSCSFEIKKGTTDQAKHAL